MLHVIRVHGTNLLPSGRSQDLDDLDKLVDTRLSRKQRLTEHELCHDAAGRPDIWPNISASTSDDPPGRKLTDLGGVICGTENQLRSSVVTRADVGDVRLIFNQYFRAPKVAKFENTGRGIEQKILGLDISMADTHRVDVSEGTKQLVDVDLDLKYGHGRFHFVEKARCAIDGLGDIFKD